MKLKCISISSHFSSHLVLCIMSSIFRMLKQATQPPKPSICTLASSKCSHLLATFNHFPSTHFMFLTKTSSYPKKKDELIPHFSDTNFILPPPIAEINTGIRTNVRSQVWQLIC
jgi:hypothetical protein